MTLPHATLFPQALLPLYIFEPRYRAMLHDALHTHRMFTIAMQRPGRVRETPCRVAGLGLIRASVQHKDGTSHLLIQGLSRVELAETVQSRPYRVQRMRPLPTPPCESVRVDALAAKVLELVALCLQRDTGPTQWPPNLLNAGGWSSPAGLPPMLLEKRVLNHLRKVPRPDLLADLVSCTLLSSPVERQTILETIDLPSRLRKLIHFLMAQLERARNDPPS